jgi:hypothetical protein
MIARLSIGRERYLASRSADVDVDCGEVGPAKLRWLAGSDEPPTPAIAADISNTIKPPVTVDIVDREEKVSRAICLRCEYVQSAEAPLRLQSTLGI